MRHLEAWVAADQDAARDGGIAVTGAHLVDGVVQRNGVGMTLHGVEILNTPLTYSTRC